MFHAVEDQLDFAHDRIRETAYEAIPPLRRRLLHGQVAEALEQCYADNVEPHLLAIARHHREAESWERAVNAFRLAGRAAAARGRLLDARAHIDDAIGGLDHLGETPEALALAVDLRFDLRNVLFPLGEMATLLERLLEAEKLATRLGDSERLGRALDYLCNHLLVTGTPRAGLEFGDRARGIAETLDDVRFRISVSFHLGAAYVNLGEHAKGEAALTAVEEWTAGDLLGDLCGMAVLPSVIARGILPYSLADRGRFTDAIAQAQEGVKIARRFNHDYSLAMALNTLGYVYGQQGEFSLMAEALESAIGVARDKNFGYFLPSIEGHLGYAYVRTQREADGLTLLARSDAAMTAMRLRGFEATVLVEHVWSLLLVGRCDEAEARGLAALAVLSESSQRVHEAWMLFLLGAIAASPSRLDTKRAREHYAAALTRAEALELAPLATHCEHGLGELARREGRNEEAATRLDSAARRFRAMNMRF